MVRAVLSPFFLVVALSACQATPAASVRTLPVAPVENPAPQGVQTAVFAGGCFWGIEGVFERLKGVSSAVSGYSGGHAQNPTYEEVSSGSTGHAESVEVTYDPKVVSYGTLLRVFLSVACDPTQLDYQGPDHGTQYRSALFVKTPGQKAVAEAYLASLSAAKVFSAAPPLAGTISVTTWTLRSAAPEFKSLISRPSFLSFTDGLQNTSLA